jgi:hypothetical protein
MLQPRKAERNSNKKFNPHALRLMPVYTREVEIILL